MLDGIDNELAEAETLYIKSFSLHLFPNGDDVYMPHNTTIIRIKDNDSKFFFQITFISILFFLTLSIYM